ncbi:hypothetical protein ABZP36_006001 [Zizania latifolia]
MEVSARLLPPPASPAPRRGLGSLSLTSLFASARPASRTVSAKIRACATYDLQRNKSNLESLFCYDKSVPEENIGTPAGLDLEKKNVGENPPCIICETKGAVLCATCAGSGLYIDSILESQGIIVKAVEALGTLCAPSVAAVDTRESPRFGSRCNSSSIFYDYVGFKREDIRVLVDNHGRLRTLGERPIAGSRWSRFQKDFELPADCNVDGIRAKFEKEELTITLPKKSPSPVQPPAPAPAAALRPPPALPELPKQSPPPRARLPTTLQPAPSQRPAERRPSLPRRPSLSEPAASTPAPPPPVPAPVAAPGAVNRSKSDLASLLKPNDQDKVEEAKKPLPPAATEAATETKDEEEKQTDREARGKMQEDRTTEEKEKGATEEVVGGEKTDMAQRRSPVSASRGLLVNVAVAVVVLVSIAVYVWHTLRNATTGGGTGDHGHGGDLGAATYRDEM